MANSAWDCTREVVICISDRSVHRQIAGRHLMNVQCVDSKHGMVTRAYDGRVTQYDLLDEHVVESMKANPISGS